MIRIVKTCVRRLFPWQTIKYKYEHFVRIHRDSHTGDIMLSLIPVGSAIDVSDDAEFTIIATTFEVI